MNIYFVFRWVLIGCVVLSGIWLDKYQHLCLTVGVIIGMIFCVLIDVGN